MKKIIGILVIIIIILSWVLFIVFPSGALDFIPTWKDCSQKNHGQFHILYIYNNEKYIWNCENGVYPQYYKVGY